ncbi:hypothetical protein BASA81_005857 [Batrachochytrium salamandrivorans]|nr:hypothetical protein BASA81_005857 [Batrachochytrium salamandrivorans]
MSFEFLFQDGELAGEVTRAVQSPATLHSFLGFCLLHQFRLSSNIKQQILISLLDLPKAEGEHELLMGVCNAFEQDESEPWLGVLCAMVENHFQGEGTKSNAFLDTLRDVQLAIPPTSTNSLKEFTLPKHVVPKHWAFLQSELLPEGFDCAETMRNEHFETTVTLPDRIAPIFDSIPSRRDQDLIRLFFMKGINLEKITEIFLEQGDTVLMEGKPVAMNTYLKLDPNPEKKVWNTVKRGEKPKPAKKPKTMTTTDAGGED